MKRRQLEELISKCLKEIKASKLKKEANTTGGGASFSPGQGAQHTGKKAFKKNAKTIDYSVGTGLKKYKGKKRPYNTKLFDYL